MRFFVPREWLVGILTGCHESRQDFRGLLFLGLFEAIGSVYHTEVLTCLCRVFTVLGKKPEKRLFRIRAMISDSLIEIRCQADVAIRAVGIIEAVNIVRLSVP